MKIRVKILEEVQSYEIGKVYRLAPSFAKKIIRIGKATEVLDPVRKEEKKVIITKEEKIEPETPEPEPVRETKSFIDISISKLKGQVKDLDSFDLADLLKDSRVSAIKLAQEEIKRRAS